MQHNVLYVTYQERLGEPPGAHRQRRLVRADSRPRLVRYHATPMYCAGTTNEQVRALVPRRRMNKSELSSHVAGGASLSKAQAGQVVDAVFSALADALARDESVVIPGFGTFSTKTREARQGRNPRTGESIAIAASKVPSFKAGKTLRDAMRG